MGGDMGRAWRRSLLAAMKGGEGRRRREGINWVGRGDPEEWIQVGGFSLPLLWVAAYILGRDAESVGSRGV